MTPLRLAPALFALLGLAWLGSTVLAQLPNRLVVRGDSPFDRLGHSVSGIGDVDGDGVPDFIAGAPFDDNNGQDTGSARVFSGATTSPSGSPVSGVARIYSGATGVVLHSFAGSGTSLTGRSVSAAGDIDGDGFDNVIVGSPNAFVAGINTGRADVYSGLTGGILHSVFGAASGDQMGTAVSDAGDVDADGVSDFLVSASEDSTSLQGGGGAGVFSGLNGARGNLLLQRP